MPELQLDWEIWNVPSPEQWVEKARNGMVWKCPNCGALLEKELSREAFFALKASWRTFFGTNTCGNCGSSYNSNDIYSGNYDASMRDIEYVAMPPMKEIIEQIEPIVQASRHENAKVRNRAVMALVEIIRVVEKYEDLPAGRGTVYHMSVKAVGPLVVALKDSDPMIRGSAAEALGKIGDRRVLEPLTQALKDTNAEVRNKVAEALNLVKSHHQVT